MTVYYFNPINSVHRPCSESLFFSIALTTKGGTSFEIFMFHHQLLKEELTQKTAKDLLNMNSLKDDIQKVYQGHRHFNRIRMEAINPIYMLTQCLGDSIM